MKRGRRKNLRRKQDLRLKECQSLVSVRGSNQIEKLRREQDFRLKKCQSIEFSQANGEYARGDNSLASLPKRMRPQKAVTQGKRRRRYMCCEVPFDVVIEILLRLPAKSLLRFKCVSKQWLSLISCPSFRHRLFTFSRQEQQYMSLEDVEGQRILLSISLSPDKTCYVVDGSITGHAGLSLNVFRGLVCLPSSGTPSVYNSTTRQVLTLPENGYPDGSSYYIGYDPVNDQYKIVCMRLGSECVWVLLLEAGGGSWREVLVPPESYHHHFPSKQEWLTNGSVVHYTAWINEYTCAVVSFDMRSEELTIIPVPKEGEEAGDVVEEATWTKKGLVKYGGSIAVFDHTRLEDEGLVDLWVLEEKKWLEKKRLVLQPCQRHLVSGDIELVVRGTTQDGKLIFAPFEMVHSHDLYILFYDVHNNDLSKVEIKGVPPLWSNKNCYFRLRLMDESERERSFCFKSLNCC